MSILEVNKLACSRRDNILFQKLSFSLEDGGLLQINGVNGSGKSSLLQMCVGLIQISAGEIGWNGDNINDCRYQYQNELCYFGHSNGVKASLTARENMAVMYALSGSSANIDYETILTQIGLPGMADVLTGKMSAGQKRRIGLARFLMSTAKLWVLDEPFNALDKQGKSIIEQMIVNHCKDGGMAIFATHQAMEIDGYTLQHIHLGQD